MYKHLFDKGTPLLLEGGRFLVAGAVFPPEGCLRRRGALPPPSPGGEAGAGSSGAAAARPAGPPRGPDRHLLRRGPARRRGLRPGLGGAHGFRGPFGVALAVDRGGGHRPRLPGGLRRQGAGGPFRARVRAGAPRAVPSPRGGGSGQPRPLRPPRRRARARAGPAHGAPRHRVRVRLQAPPGARRGGLVAEPAGGRRGARGLDKGTAVRPSPPQGCFFSHPPLLQGGLAPGPARGNPCPPPV